MTRVVPEGGSERSTEFTGRLTHPQVMRILGGLLLALFVASLSGTVVATALPTIVGQLGGQDKLAWVISATLLALTASTPLWGKMSDLYGRKRLFMWSIVIFVIGSALAGLSQNITELIASRAVQGVGAGGLTALTQAILADIVPPRERGRYSGYLGSSFGLATVAGPLIGGFLVDTGESGWRWCFYVGIPVAAAALIIIQRTLRIPLERRDAKVDYWGATTITGSVSSLMLLLSLGGKEFDWMSGWTAILAVFSAGLLVAAIVIERRVPEPILPPRLFTSRTFVLCGIAGLFTGMAMFGVISYMPTYLQLVKEQSATVSGLLTVPMVVGLLSTSIGSGQLITRLGRWKIFPVIGLVVAALGMYLLSTLRVDTSLVLTGLFMFVLGTGIGMTIQVLILAVQNTVAPGDIGVGTSTASFFRSMGGAIGVSIFGAILSSRLTHLIPELLVRNHANVAPGTDLSELLTSPAKLRTMDPAIANAVREGYTEALHTVFLVGTPLALLGWLAVLAVREIPLRTKTHHEERLEQSVAE